MRMEKLQTSMSKDMNSMAKQQNSMAKDIKAIRDYQHKGLDVDVEKLQARVKKIDETLKISYVGRRACILHSNNVRRCQSLRNQQRDFTGTLSQAFFRPLGKVENVNIIRLLWKSFNSFPQTMPKILRKNKFKYF